MERGYRFRFYPTPRQERHLAKAFGCARWVSNFALEEISRPWREREERLSWIDISRRITELKGGRSRGCVRCSVCGFVLERMGLGEREWTCPECGVRHDRDVNAARNLSPGGSQDGTCTAGRAETDARGGRNPPATFTGPSREARIARDRGEVLNRPEPRLSRIRELQFRPAHAAHPSRGPDGKIYT
jgi:hypothetical protein